MFKISLIFEGINNLEKYLDKCNFDKKDKCLVKFFTSSLDKDEVLDTVKDIRMLLPHAQIVGSSSSVGVVFDGKQYDNESLIVIEKYEESELVVSTFSWKEKSVSEIADKVHKYFSKYKYMDPVINALFSDKECNVCEFLDELNKFDNPVRLQGGIAGDIVQKNIAGYVFTEDGFIEEGAVAFYLLNKNSYDFVNVSTSMDVISEEHKVTKSKGKIIEEIDGKDALEWMYSFLEIEEKDIINSDDFIDATNKDYLKHFPIMVDYDNSIGYFTEHDKKSGKLTTISASLKEGTAFKIGYVNPFKTIQETYSLCEKIAYVPIEHLFTYSCISRKLLLNNCANWEMKPFDNYNVCGIFLFGEIAFIDGSNKFFNGACVITGFAEKSKYVIPNFAAIENVDIIKDDDSFFQKARKKGYGYKDANSSQLLDTINALKIESKVNYFDYNLNLPNIYQYFEDKDKYNFNKLLLAEIETADTTIAFTGLLDYYFGCRHFLKEFFQSLEENGLSDSLLTYALNYKTFLIAPKNDMQNEFFIGFSRKMCDLYGFTTTEKTKISSVLRFAVVVNSENLLEVAQNAMILRKNSQDNFFVIDEDSNERSQLQDEIKIMEMLNKAVKNKRVIPYYQGIRDNKSGKINKYEALMRIADDNGNIFSPFIFMNIAKKHRFYNDISKLMIERVFEDFNDREETVSINLSLHDLESASFREWMLDKLSNYSNPEKIIIEFIETENYQELDVLFEFTDKIKKLGSNIAVDDFGSGYSTLSTIVALNPDYIKIDGTIIKNLTKDNANIIILDTIRYLAKQLNAYTIAEFVENEEIQEIVEKHEVSFSQGYYFSKPCPIVDIHS